MTSRSEPVVEMPVAAARIAEKLGIHTRQLVAEGDVEATVAWCLRMARENTGEGSARRSLSYLELAVLLGHRGSPANNMLGREWNDLLQATLELWTTVKAKAAEEEAARAEAEAREKPADDGDE